jgi:hypothetical protein
LLCFFLRKGLTLYIVTAQAVLELKILLLQPSKC